MHTKPTLPNLHLAARLIAATIATAITVVTLTFVAELFQRDGGRSMAHSLVAQRAKSLSPAGDDFSPCPELGVEAYRPERT
jgi:hypothetical protein